MSGTVTMEPRVTVATVTSALLSVESSDWMGQVHYSISNLKRKHAGGEKQNRREKNKITLSTEKWLFQLSALHEHPALKLHITFGSHFFFNPNNNLEHKQSGPKRIWLYIQAET